MATYDFSRLADIERIAGDRVDEVVRESLLELTQRVIFRTPVGDIDQWQSVQEWRARTGNSGRPSWLAGYVGGTARGNWQATINQPASDVLRRTDDGGQATINEARTAIEAAPGNVYYLTNNVPYIGPLEYLGWSKQNPEGMVRISLREINQGIDSAVAKLPR